MTSHTDRSTEALFTRRAIAEKATPGPWKISSNGLHIAGNINGRYLSDVAQATVITDAAHIAANDPQTIMADIDEILRLRAENKRLQCAFNDAAEKMQFIERGVKSIYENCLMFTPKQAIGESLSVLVDMMTCKAVEKQTCPKN